MYLLWNGDCDGRGIRSRLSPLYAVERVESEGKSGEDSGDADIDRAQKKETAFRSLYFHFPNTYREARLVEYIKLDDAGNQVEILLNGTEKDLDVQPQGEVLFARGYEEWKIEKKRNTDPKDMQIRSVCREQTEEKAETLKEE